MAVKGAQRGAALRGEQLQQHGLAEQVGRLQVGVAAQGQQFDAVRRAAADGADGLRDLGALGHQHVGAQGRVQAQQARVLARAQGRQVGQQ